MERAGSLQLQRGATPSHLPHGSPLEVRVGVPLARGPFVHSVVLWALSLSLAAIAWESSVGGPRPFKPSGGLSALYRACYFVPLGGHPYAALDLHLARRTLRPLPGLLRAYALLPSPIRLWSNSIGRCPGFSYRLARPSPTGPLVFSRNRVRLSTAGTALVRIGTAQLGWLLLVLLFVSCSRSLLVS